MTTVVFAQTVEQVKTEKIIVRIDKQGSYLNTIEVGLIYVKQNYKFTAFRDKFFKIGNKTFLVPGFSHKIYEVIDLKKSKFTLRRLS